MAKNKSKSGALAAAVIKQKDKKEYATDTEHKYFNKTEVPTDVSMEYFLQSILDRSEVVLKEHDLLMNIWCTFEYLRVKTIEVFASDFFLAVQLKHSWMDRYINEIGYMIWNEVNRKYHSEWFKTGVLIDVPELVKRARNGEGVAEHFANKAVAKFEEPYV